jgi:hypothetical protein
MWAFTLATVLAEAGNTVVGVEKRPDLVEMTNLGTPHFTETGLPDVLAGVARSKKLVAAERFDISFSCDTYIITVGTPLSPDGVGRLDMIESAARDIAENMRGGALLRYFAGSPFRLFKWPISGPPKSSSCQQHVPRPRRTYRQDRRIDWTSGPANCSRVARSAAARHHEDARR